MMGATVAFGAGAGSHAIVNLGAIVNGSTLGKTVLYAFIAGVGIAAVFGGGVTSAAGLLEALRARRTTAVIAWGALSVTCAGLALAAIAAGIYEMTSG